MPFLICFAINYVVNDVVHFKTLILVMYYKCIGDKCMIFYADI